MRFGWWERVAAGVLAVTAATAACAQEKFAARPGFHLPANGAARILVVRPDIRAGSQSTAGLAQPNADWTAQARDNLARALAAASPGLHASVRTMDEPADPRGAQAVAEYHALFSTVAQAVITYQFFPGNRLPTKKRDGKAGNFAWTLGPGVADLPGLGDADYLLFLHTEDEFGSTGRKVLQVFMAMARVPIQSGIHNGFAGLVDRRTGELVWLNADLAMGGDVRTPDGAEKRIGQLLAGFPGATPTPGATPAAAP